MRLRSQAWVKVAVATGCIGAHAMTASAADQRAYSNTSISVATDGVPAFVPKAVSGGEAVGTVTVESAAAFGQFRKKHLAGIRFEDIAIAFEASPNPGFVKWMSESLSGNRPSKDGNISILDYQGSQVSRLNWYKGAISEIVFPELDGGSKVAGEIKVGITAERTARSGSGGKAAAPAVNVKQQKFLANNFRITIDGLDLTRVAHVDPISVRLKSVNNRVGEMRDYEKTPGTADVSNLVFTVDSRNVTALQAWYDSFVVNGENGQDKERNGRIELLSPDMKSVLLTVGLHGLGIVRLAPETATAGAETLPRLRAELYVEYVTIEGSQG